MGKNPVPQCDCSYSELSAGERLLRWLNRRIEAKISMWDSQSSCNLCEKRCALVEVGQCEVQVSDCRGRRADNGGAERGFRGNNSDKVRSQQRINKDLLPSWLQIFKRQREVPLLFMSVNNETEQNRFYEQLRDNTWMYVCGTEERKHADTPW